VAKKRSVQPPMADIAKIVQRCMNDPVFFIVNFVKIQSPNMGGTVPFKLYPFQKDLINNMINNRFVVVNKSRQLGITTIGAAFCLWYCLFHTSQNVAAIATRAKTAANFLKKVQFGYDRLPDWLKDIFTVKNNNASTIEWDNGSKVIAEGRSGSALRGEAISWLIVDEAAWIEGFDGPDGIWAGILPTLSCVAGDTLILTDNGFIEMKDFFGGRSPEEYFELNQEVWGKDGLEQASHGYVSPESETLVVETRKGLRLEVTPKHPLYKLTRNGGKMTPASALNVGDSLRVDVGMNVWGTNIETGNFRYLEMTEEFAYLIGGYIAEGWMQKAGSPGDIRYSTLQVSNKHPDFRKAFLESNVIKPFYAPSYAPEKLTCGSRSLVQLFRDVGVNPEWKCDTKLVPKSILRAPKRIVSAFLRGLFDGDGCCSSRGVCLASTSRKLIQQVQLLMLNMGIVCTVHCQSADSRACQIGRVMPSGQKLAKLKDIYQLRVPRCQYAKYRSEIGFCIDYKADLLDEFCDMFSSDEIKQFSIPLVDVQDTIKEIVDYSGLSYYRIRQMGLRLDKIMRPKNIENSIVTSDSMRRFRQILGNANVTLLPHHEHFFEEVTAKCFWDPIVSITPSTNKTYDLTVPETHTFLQNGIIGSNTGGRCLMLSSPGGTHGVFYETYIKAKNDDENPWVAMELPWDIHPDRDEAWLENERAVAGDERLILQEYFCQFTVSGDAVISQDLRQYMNDLQRQHLTNPFVGDSRYWEWDRPVEGEMYVIGADVAGGNASDYSTIQVIRAATGFQVAEYKHKMYPDDFAEFVMKVGHYWNTAPICIENNSIAQAAISKIREKGYPKMYSENRQGMARVEHVYPGYEEVDFKIGFNTQHGSRQRLVTEMVQRMEKHLYTSFSKRLIEEFNTFVWKNRKAQHSKGSNDDLVIAWALAIWCRESVVGVASSDAYTEAMAAGIKISGQKTNQSEGMSAFSNVTRDNRYNQGVYTNKSHTQRVNNEMNGGSGLSSFYEEVAKGGGGERKVKGPKKSDRNRTHHRKKIR